MANKYSPNFLRPFDKKIFYAERCLHPAKIYNFRCVSDSQRHSMTALFVLYTSAEWPLPELPLSLRKAITLPMRKRTNGSS